MSTSQSLSAPNPPSSNLKWKTGLLRPTWTKELGSFPNDKPKMAQVARLQICKADLESCQKLGTHLIIRKELTELKSGNATAISYAWGEFDRKRIVVGHSSGEDSDSIIEMELGEEWDIEDFITTLAQLSATQPIWIDQLCTPKKDKELREVLAKIPQIYNGFDVAAIMPGHPCKCLPTVPDNSGEDEWSVLRFVGPQSHLGFCLNAHPISSWMERLWTRQELLFSTRIRCVWASKTLAKCVPLDETRGYDAINEEDLQRFASLELDRLRLGARNNRLAALRLLKERSDRRFDKLRFEIGKYVEDPLALEEPDEERSFQAVYTFLSGSYVSRDGLFLRGNEVPPAMGTQTLYYMLPAEGASVRKATQEPDYVVAIFVGFQYYKPPENYENIAVGELLQMALDMFFFHNNGITFLSTAPQGLFNSKTTSSGLWQPEHYLQSLKANSKINSVADVYAPLSFCGLLSVDMDLGAIPLAYQRLPDAPDPSFRLLDPFHIRPLSTFSSSLQDFFINDLEIKDPVEVLVLLRSYIRSWHKKSIMALYSLTNDLKLEEAAIDRGTLYVLKLMLGIEDLEEVSGDGLAFHDIHDAFYSVVCTALYLDTKVCLKERLELVFSPPMFEVKDNPEDNTPRIGLHRVHAEPFGNEVNDTLTIKMGRGKDYLLFEGENITKEVDAEEKFKKIKKTGKPGFRIFGVWVPRNRLCWPEYGAESLMDHSGVIDAYLV